MKVREPEAVTDYSRGGDSPRVTLDGPAPGLPPLYAGVVPPGSDKSEEYWLASGVKEQLDRHSVVCNGRIEWLESAVKTLAQQLRDMQQHPMVRPK